jgi:hypothetical protein
MSHRMPTSHSNSDHIDRAFREFFAREIPATLPELKLDSKPNPKPQPYRMDPAWRSRFALAASVLVLIGIVNLMGQRSGAITPSQPGFGVPKLEDPTAKLRPDLRKALNPAMR